MFGIPPERVIGSSVSESYQSGDVGHIIRGESVGLIDDGPTKPIQIWDRVGRRPILAAGNANGDISMLEYAGGDRPVALRLVVNHDDAERETEYTAGAEKLMKQAVEQDWAVISMCRDWKQVFSHDEDPE